MKSKSKASTSGKESKVGSDPDAIRKVGGSGDFGVPVSDVRGREYASRETKQNDPGAAPNRLKDGDGTRESGVGANDNGPGSGSGGDIDTDIVGVGFGGNGLAADGPDRTEGADIVTDGSSDPFAAPGPKGHARREAAREFVQGSTVDHSGGDITTTGDGLDSGSASNPNAQGEDSFAADIQLDEGAGEDNAASDDR